MEFNYLFPDCLSQQL